MIKDTPFVTIFTGSALEAGYVRSMLESAGIAVLLDGEHIGTTAPHLASAGGVGAVKVAVASGDARRAKELIATRVPNP